MNRFDFAVIRNLRKKYGITAEKLAEKANVTRSTIVKIEKGEGNPTIGTIEALANVFQLAPSELVCLAEKSKKDFAQTKSFKTNNYTGKHIWFPDFEIFYIKAKAGVHKDSDLEYHENTPEICLVLSGTILITVGGETTKLNAGMAMKFKALHDHFFDVIEDAEFLLIHYSPV